MKDGWCVFVTERVWEQHTALLAAFLAVRHHISRVFLAFSIFGPGITHPVVIEAPRGGN